MAEAVWGLCLGLVPSILLAAEEINQAMLLCFNSSLSLLEIYRIKQSIMLYIGCYQEDSSLSARVEHDF